MNNKSEQFFDSADTLEDYKNNLSRFFEDDDTKNGNQYFYSVSYDLDVQKDVETRLKFHLYYLDLLSKKKPMEKMIPTLFDQILDEFRKSETDDRLGSLMLYIYKATIGIIASLDKIGAYPDIASLYHKGTQFFIEYSQLDHACRLLIEKAQLYQTKFNDRRSATLCLNKVLQIKYIQCLKDGASNQSYGVIIGSLQKLSDYADPTEKKLYSSLAQLLTKCESEIKNLDDVFTSFLSFANEVLEKKKPMLCKQLDYIGQILLHRYKVNNSDTLVIDENNLENLGVSLINRIKDLSSASDIFLAIQQNQLDKVKSLVAAGISIEDTNLEGLTPLCYAVSKGFEEIVKFLIDSGARVNYNEKKIIDTPIYFAVKFQNHAIADLLINAGADVNAPTREGNSVLFIASQNNDRKMMRALKLRGAQLLRGEKEKLKSNPHFSKTDSIEDLKQILIPLTDAMGLKNTIFCIHSLSGEVTPYKPLASAIHKIDKTRPVWGINSPNYLNANPTAMTIKEMASLYIRAIRLVQPLGPYILCGLGEGGSVAFEMAYQLAEQERPVILVGLFDTFCPLVLRNMDSYKFAKYLISALTPLVSKTKIYQTNPNLFLIDKNDLAKYTNDKQIDVVITLFQKNLGDAGSPLMKLLYSAGLYLHAILEYVPKNDQYTPFLQCFNTKESMNECGVSDLGWSVQTGGKIFVKQIKGAHNNILDVEQTVQFLANYILHHPQVSRSDAALGINNIAPTIKRYQATLSYLTKDNDDNKTNNINIQILTDKGIFKSERNILDAMKSKAPSEFNSKNVFFR